MSIDFQLPETSSPRLIAFHLPQFHPIAENDAWWGKGFTEWRNVVKARPLFEGHAQPHLPADLGFYDLRLPEAREAQAALARAYGVHGFCYYHYWFHGKRLLERPVNEIVASGKPDFPFCLCWANENWTKVWDGQDRQILMEQAYSEADDLAHIRSLMPVFKDERYIKIDGKPLFLVYRASDLPNALRTTEAWREEALKAGLPGLFLVRVESQFEAGDPRLLGFDSALEFQPRAKLLDGARKYRQKWWQRHALGTGLKAFKDHVVYDYDTLVEREMQAAPPQYPFIRCVCPGWDNTARRAKGGIIFEGSTPASYERWLSSVIEQTKRVGSSPGLVFVNAWNEWAEGNHLEPCQRWGRAYLEATRNAVLGKGQASQ